MKPEPHPKNASGPFYVVNGFCLACTAPEHEAPELIAHVSEPGYHCYFKKQPSTKEELSQAIQAVRVACCQMVRYAGDDLRILACLPEVSCDHPRSMET